MTMTLSLLDNATPTPATVSLTFRTKKESTRNPINWIKLNGSTAVGSTTVSGVTAIASTFVWDIKTRIKEWELQKLHRMIRLQQDRFGTSPSTAQMTLRDLDNRINSLEYNLNGRTAVGGSALTFMSETTYFSDFKVFAEIVPNGVDRLNPWLGLEGDIDLSLLITEIV